MQQHVPLGGHYKVYRDAGDGAVDYANSIGPSPIAAFLDGAGKIGAGLGGAGMGVAGLGDGGVGAGLGAAGMGPAGFGASWHTFADRRRPDGTWTYGVVAFDAVGNPTAPAAATEATVTLMGTPRQPTDLAIDSYDSVTDTARMTISLSPDDG